MAAAAALHHHHHHHPSSSLRRNDDDDVNFSSVFPPKGHTTATPEATPYIGPLKSPGAAFGGLNVSPDPADEALRFNRAWSAVTRFLTLPPGLEDVTIDLSESTRIEDTLEYLLDSKSTRRQLLTWYLYQISTHFREFVLPRLNFWQEPIPVEAARDALSQTVHVVGQAQSLYLALGTINMARYDATRKLDIFVKQVQRDFHVLLIHALPRSRVQKTLACYLFTTMKDNLRESESIARCSKQAHCQCAVALDLNALGQLHNVGLGGVLGERAFAHAVHRLLQGPAVERLCFRVDWNGRKCVVPRLRMWVHERLVPALEKAVSTLAGNSAMKLPAQQFVSAAVNSFGRLRVNSLFDYVSSWDHSQGAVLDIKEYLSANGSGEKTHLCASFSEQIQRRLFHAGASTTEILSVYISVIHVFRLLDPRGVLLEKVAIPIRSYLRSREDTVSTIAVSFLADVESDTAVELDHDKVCEDIAKAVASSAMDAQENWMLNWDDMEWMPDPIDAGPDYKSAKSDDVVAYIIGLFEPEDFLKAFSTALGQHLLETRDKDFIKETKVIELLKSRLDSGKLQHAEVMLKDMRESVNLNKRLNPDRHKSLAATPPTPREIQAALPEDGITLTSLYDMFKSRIEGTPFQAALKLVAHRRQDLYFPKRTRLPAQRTTGISGESKPSMDFEAKVISSYFWPQLRDGNFKVPEQVIQQRERYDDTFSRISRQRKLLWKSVLDTTDLTLELSDRTIVENDVEVWKSSIIDAFATERQGNAGRPPIEYDDDQGLSVSDLMDALDMPEDYVQGGISFWMSKHVLYEKSPGKYAVLERLDMDVQFLAEPSQLDMEEAGAIMSEQAMLRLHAPTFQTFIEQMLTNGGAKEIEGIMGITNVMKMVLPSFTYGDDEVKWLLEDMEVQGRVRKQGEAWAV